MTGTTERQQRFEHGRAVLDAIDGTAGADVIDALADISRAGHQVVAWPSAITPARPGLVTGSQTLGMLIALGGCEPQLDKHINASLNVSSLRSRSLGALHPPSADSPERHVHCEEGLRRARLLPVSSGGSTERAPESEQSQTTERWRRVDAAAAAVWLSDDPLCVECGAPGSTPRQPGYPG